MLTTARKKGNKKLTKTVYKGLDFNKLTESINLILWQAMVREKKFRRTSKD